MPHNQQTAGVFDIRNVIGGLIGLYGVVLVVMGIFGDQALDKTGGVNANLWAGIVMVLVGAAMLLWARLRPVVVEEEIALDERPPQDRER